MRIYLSTLKKAVVFFLCINCLPLTAQDCVTFTGLPTGTYAVTGGYPIGTPFHTESGMPVTLAPYHYPNGTVKNNVSALAGEFFWSGLFIAANTTYIKLLTSGMHFDFTQPQNGKIAGTVTFDFLDWSGYVNLTVNDNPVNVETTYSLMPNEIAPGVTMQVTDQNVGSGGKMGSVILSGDIYSISVAAENFGIDNLCFILKDAPSQTCAFSDLSVVASDCTPNGVFSVDIDFAHENSSGTFSISGNGTNYGNFNTSDLPVTLNSLVGDGITDYEFVITDSQDATCTVSTNIGSVFCPLPCSFSNMTTTSLACNNGNFSVLIDFEHENSSGQFNLTGNGAAYGTYNIADLPIQLGTFPGDGSTVYSFTATDVTDPNCSTNNTLGIITCFQPCVISNLDANVEACDANGDFMVNLDFSHENTSMVFTVSGNGNDYGSFNTTDLPVALGPFNGDGTTNYEFVVTDAQVNTCSAQTSIGTINCAQPCAYSNLVAAAQSCDNGEFEVLLDFDHENASSSFTVSGNGNNYGSYDITELPITIGPLEGDDVTDYEFTVQDADHPNCTASTNLGTVYCEPACFFNSFSIVQDDCQNGTFQVLIDFDASNTSGSFEIGGNGNFYGDYTTADLPLSLGPFDGDGSTVYEFIITDLEYGDCEEYGEVGPVTCEVIQECGISNLNISNMDCTSASTFSAIVDFDYENVGNGGFRMFYQGQQVGIFDYSELPLNLNNLNHGMEPMESIQVCDTNNPNCCQTIEFESMDCSGAGCLISEVLLNRRPCEDGQFMVDLDLNIQAGGLLGFQVLGNSSHYGTHSYSDLPITLGPFDGDGENQYEFIVIDMLDQTCQNIGELEVYNCIEECSISEITPNIGSCTDQGETFVLLSFTSDNTSPDYSVYVNGTNQGNQSYSDGAITVGPLLGDGTTIYEITLIDNESNVCNSSVNVGPIECEQAVSTTELNDAEVRVYTNPASEQLFLEVSSGMGKGEMAVYNAVGQNLMNDQIAARQGEYQYDISQLAAGVYFCRVLIDGKMKTWKFSRL